MGDSYPGGTGVLTYQQIQNLWINNGGDPRWAPLMASIAMAESGGGHPGVLNDTPSTGDYSVGLWQINFYGGNAGRASQGVYGGGPGMSYQQVAAKLANDPNQQAKAAISLFANGAGNSNWQGDAAWKAWKAAGAPPYPTQAQLASAGAPTSGAAGTPYTGGASEATPSGGGNSNLPPGITIPNPLDAGASSITIISGTQELTIKGWFLMIAGGFIGVVGIAVVLASLGLESRIGRVVAGGTAVGRAAGTVKKAAPSSSAPAAPPPPKAADAFKAGEKQGARDENARIEGRRANERNRRASGPRVEGAPRRATQPHKRRGVESLTPRERESVESF